MNRLGVDVGGTFTDCMLFDSESGSVRIEKRLTTARDPCEAVIAAALALASRSGANLRSVAHVVHATTLVTNALIERKGANTGLITTEGYRDTLEIGRDVRYDLFDLSIERPEPLVPRFLRTEVAERLAWDGSVLRPLESQSVLEAAELFRRERVESVAVSFLHAYRNPVHESLVRELLNRALPGVPVSLSSEICPEIREYERTSTTVANAYVRPVAERYLRRLAEELAGNGFGGRLSIMTSWGGITGVEMASAAPVQLAESGPAAGAIAAAHLGELLGRKRILSFDMGGTTAKICFVDGGRPDRSAFFEAARVRRFKRGSGLILRVPVIELVEIGAGGGSIARWDPMGLLKVGPDSAGADPGPACYGCGGSVPTVTDADLILGYLNPSYFLGGRMELRTDAARRAVGELASVLGMKLIDVAAGIHEVVNEQMAAATRVHACEKGRDPREYELMAFGGAGPVHAYGLARRLGIRRIICPSAAGVASAFGLLVAPLGVELVQSYVVRLDHIDSRPILELFAKLEHHARSVLTAAGARPEDVEIRRVADMRYVGQGYEVPVSLEGVDMMHSAGKRLTPEFYAAYESRFSRRVSNAPIEVVSWRLVATAPSPSFIGQPAPQVRQGSAFKGSREVYFGEVKGFIECPVLSRYGLPHGESIPGPIIVEENESTLVVGPSGRLHVDDSLSLVVEMGD